MSERFPVAVDGIFADWDGIEVCWEDPGGDGSAVDFGSVRVRSDSERVTLLLDLGSEMSLQGGNKITAAKVRLKQLEADIASGYERWEALEQKRDGG